MLVILLIAVGILTRESLAASGTYKILAWNDLGMHCYSRDFADLAVLPPYNTLWVQVVKVGDPPELVTSGITVEYSYPDNTYSVGKTNFWDYDQALFGVDLPPNVGLKNKGLSGTMDLSGDHFVAEGIPITEFSDSAPTVRQPYQLATVVVKDATTHEVLTSIQVVTPTSSEMRCDTCHGDTGIAKPSLPTGKVETNILQLHDENAGTTLMASRPVLCASCHASNALGAAGQPGIKNLSKSMHEKHASVVPSTLDGCYNCHPGPQTRCLRDVMATEEGMTCVSCHGGLGTVATNPNPWLHEPRCDSCHNSGRFNQDQALYRFSKGHGGLYCESCHDSTHAVAPSREANDAIKFNQLQGKNGPIEECSVCHSPVPGSGGPHSSVPPRVSSITRANSNPTSATTVNFTVTFSRSVTGVDVGDFNLSTTGLVGTTISTVKGSGTVYTVAVNTGTGAGTIRLDVMDNDSIVDASSVPLGGVGLGNGNFTTGQEYTITQSTLTPGVPALLSPANGALVTSLQPVFDWKDSTPAALSYQIQVAGTTAFTSLVIDEKNVPASTFTPVSDLAPGKLYYWRVKAFNGIGGASNWSAVRNFKTPLAAPVLVSPLNGDPLLTDRPTFDWEAVSGATSYMIQVSAANTFSGLLLNVTVNPTEYTMVKDLLQDKPFYWRVAARSSVVTGPWSATGSFKTGNPPGVPNLSLPANNALLKDYRPIFKWSVVTAPAPTTFDHYQLQVDDDPAFGSLDVDENIPTRTVPQFQPAGSLNSNTKYYWRVRSFNTNGHYSGWSAVRSFRTLIAAPQSLTVLPNGLRPSFDWANATGTGTITSYTIQISTSPTFSSLLVNATTSASTYTMQKDLPPGRTIYWRVRVNGANGPSAWSTGTFTTP